ncbi:hypothetical protein ASG66_10160 [Bacillus sp. Leaf406]|nr:hypothetical protein ASG66_10160 [Bacillus sp. Leaf406]
MDMKYFVEVVGSGPAPLIFLPGTGWAGNVGHSIAEALSNSYTVHMIDLPGIGRGDGPFWHDHYGGCSRMGEGIYG